MTDVTSESLRLWSESKGLGCAADGLRPPQGEQSSARGNGARRYQRVRSRHSPADQARRESARNLVSARRYEDEAGAVPQALCGACRDQLVQRALSQPSHDLRHRQQVPSSEEAGLLVRSASRSALVRKSRISRIQPWGRCDKGLRLIDVRGPPGVPRADPSGAFSARSRRCCDGILCSRIRAATRPMPARRRGLRSLRWRVCLAIWVYTSGERAINYRIGVQGCRCHLQADTDLRS